MATKAARAGQNPSSTHPNGHTATRDGRTASGQPAPSAVAPPPDVASGLWLAWLNSQRGAPEGQGVGALGTPLWLMPPDAAAGEMRSAGVDQVARRLANDPLLTSIDRIWNAL